MWVGALPEATCCHIYFDGQRYLSYCWFSLTTASLHRWMTAGDGSSAGVFFASPEAQIVPHVSMGSSTFVTVFFFNHHCGGTGGE